MNSDSLPEEQQIPNTVAFGKTLAFKTRRNAVVGVRRESADRIRGISQPQLALKNVEHVFGILMASAQAIQLSPNEHTAFCWLPYREAADRCFSPSNAEAILHTPQMHLLFLS